MLQIGKPPLQTPEGRTFNSRFHAPGHECENLWCVKGGSLQDNFRKCRKGVFLLVLRGAWRLSPSIVSASRIISRLALQAFSISAFQVRLYFMV